MTSTPLDQPGSDERPAIAAGVVIQLSGGPLDGRLVELKASSPPGEYRVPRRQRTTGPWGGWVYTRTAETTLLGLPVYRYVDGS